MPDLEDQIAQSLAEAEASGELRSAESWGKPLAEMEGWEDTPLALRLPFKILKNAGVAPPELELFRQRAELRARLDAASEPEEQQRLRTALGEMEQRIALRLEGVRLSARL